jgi:hypothetical protein
MSPTYSNVLDSTAVTLWLIAINVNRTAMSLLSALDSDGNDMTSSDNMPRRQWGYCLKISLTSDESGVLPLFDSVVSTFTNDVFLVEVTSDNEIASDRGIDRVHLFK